MLYFCEPSEQRIRTYNAHTGEITTALNCSGSIWRPQCVVVDAENNMITIETTKLATSSWLFKTAHTHTQTQSRAALLELYCVHNRIPNQHWDALGHDHGQRTRTASALGDRDGLVSFPAPPLFHAIETRYAALDAKMEQDQEQEQEQAAATTITKTEMKSGLSGSATPKQTQRQSRRAHAHTHAHAHAMAESSGALYFVNDYRLRRLTFDPKDTNTGSLLLSRARVCVVLSFPFSLFSAFLSFTLPFAVRCWLQARWPRFVAAPSAMTSDPCTATARADLGAPLLLSGHFVCLFKSFSFFLSLWFCLIRSFSVLCCVCVY